jgi:small neutral amino acid transporter SnatA (MarC family)
MLYSHLDNNDDDDDDKIMIIIIIIMIIIVATIIAIYVSLNLIKIIKKRGRHVYK